MRNQVVGCSSQQLHPMLVFVSCAVAHAIACCRTLWAPSLGCWASFAPALDIMHAYYYSSPYLHVPLIAVKRKGLPDLSHLALQGKSSK